VRLDREVKENIQKFKEKFHQETSAGSTWLGQKNENRSKCIGLYNRKSSINEV